MYKKHLFFLFAGLFAFFLQANSALAIEVDTIAENATNSISLVPGIITAISYLLALVFGVTGVLKLKEHVENPSQTALRISIIRFMVGGGLLALPIVLEALVNTINPDSTLSFTLSEIFTFTGLVAAGNGALGSGPTADGFNAVLNNIGDSINSVPGVITAVSYMLGLILCVAGLLKVREHVENPEQTPLRESVTRFLVAGGLFSLPAIYSAAFMTITGVDADDASYSMASTGLGIMYQLGIFSSTYAPSTHAACSSAGSTLGGVACNIAIFTSAAPTFLEGISYIFGSVLGVWALLKIRDHVLNPTQTPIWEGISRLIATGGFFAMPYVAEVFRDTVAGSLVDGSNSGYDHSAGLATSCTSGSPLSLDYAMACFVYDIMGPMQILLNFFAWIAGLIFIMIGISRIMKSAQEGARAPGGLGTLVTFLTGGILISYNAILGAVSGSMFETETDTIAALSYTSGMTTTEVDHAERVIEAVIQFMIIVGIISFVRGWFIMRDVAEGNQQASSMAGVTHIVGGALAVNLGPLLNAVQETLNISGVGVGFS